MSLCKRHRNGLKTTVAIVYWDSISMKINETCIVLGIVIMIKHCNININCEVTSGVPY